MVAKHRPAAWMSDCFYDRVGRVKSLRDIIRPSDLEAARYQRARELRMTEFVRGEQCGLGVISLMGILDLGVFLAWSRLS